MGYQEREYGIVADSDICALGEVIYNKDEKTFTLKNPTMLGKSKENIM